MLLPIIPPNEVVRLVEWDYYPEIRNDERRHVTPQVAERSEPRLDPLGVALAKLLNSGVIAAIAGLPARLVQARGHKGLSGEGGEGVA